MENDYETALKDILNATDEHATTPNKQSESWFPTGKEKDGGGPLRDKRVTLKKVLLRDKKAKKVRAVEGHPGK